MSQPISFKNNNTARGSQGFVGQSSRNSVTRVEQPSVLNNFYFHSLDGSTVGTRKRLCVFGGRGLRVFGGLCVDM